jgi:hypothetical protein
MSKISRTVRGGKEVARNVRKGCRTLDEEECRSCRPPQANAQVED